MRRDPAIYILAVGQTLSWASIYYVFPALLLRWEQDLGWSKADLTAAIMLAVLVSAMASPLTGRIIDKGQGALLVAGSAIAGGVGLILLAHVVELWQFYAAWLILGLAMAGCLYEPCFALVTRSRGKDAKPAIILITLVAGFASTISYPVFYTLSENMGWRNALLVGAATMFVVVAPLLWLGVRKLEAGAKEQIKAKAAAEPSRKFLRYPAFWCLGLGFTCLAIAHGAALHHLLLILDERGLSEELAVLAASFIGPMQVAGRIAMMSSERFTSHHGLALAAFGAMAVSMISLLMSGSSPAFVSGFVILFGSSYGIVSILRPVLARDILGEADFGAKSGALAMPYLAGSALAPFLGSLIWNWGGYDLMLSTLIAVLMIGAILYSFAHRMAHHE
ncbi:MAG: MFS transporter [Pseudomonadota bacterium]